MFCCVGRNTQVQSDEGSETRTTLGDPLMLEFPVGPVHRVGIDRDLSDDVTHRRELVAVSQKTGPYGVTNLINELSVGRETTLRVKSKR